MKMDLRWYEPSVLGGSSNITMPTGYCSPCAVWWMGGHDCIYEPITEAETEQLALIRRIVDKAVRDWAEAFERL